MTVVAHHPASHAFVDNLWPGRVEGDALRTWEPERLRAAGVRVVHLHFGFEQRTADELTEWAGELRRVGIRLVHTVHDLDNPHLVDQRGFHRSVAALADAADATTTLTAWAASQLRARHGARATVIPHHHVVPLDAMASRRGAPASRRGVYVHAATGRPNLDVDAIARLVAAPGRPEVDVHVRPGAAPAVVEALEQLARRGRLHLRVEARLSDEQLWDRLQSAELLLLPYRWGTHSGLLEAAHDLGTPVLAPAFGGYGDQGATTYGDDPASMVALATASRPCVTVAARTAERDAVRAAYEALHERPLEAAS